MSEQPETTGQRYEQIADDLRRQIIDGQLAPGAKLPPEMALASHYSASRTTIRLALSQLTNEGLLRSLARRGTFVRDYSLLRWPWSQFERRSRHQDSYDGLDAWETGVRDQGRTPSLKLDVGIVQPPSKVAERLRLDPENDVAVVRRRVRYVDGVPYLLQDSYFAESTVRGTALMRPHDVTAPGGVLASIGLVQTRYVDEITIRMPSKEESGKLGLPAATPVAEHIRTGYLASGDPVRCMVSVLPGDRQVLFYELDAS